ncbi:NAD-dependent epimerase/dehydratase [Methanoregula boonei 6A8]|jgi:CDP-paratose 2-epimerase|uniref:NAD-dependent epimerase/dehydratase n=1 Tax=Methanoregula boonei (strain DSM 21154 / JCM 14090 / 6A8) TaxID=456442 RepID=A7I973_METB6|nr:NAD-dependent epimerase/dehydratase family protein [Methanoregula boonei]ABS56284.1 NAD-dependent epimerase/dehydratase [Methanoregula boonei 6A8]
MRVLITGGAGFVGSNLAIFLKNRLPATTVICFDNLKRRGSELNLTRLKVAGIQFTHGDVRNEEDFEALPPFDLMIECSAEPSVLAGVGSSPSYVMNTNLLGTINCLEAVRKNHAAILFLSTSRVYPIRPINALPFREEATRFSLGDTTGIPGVSSRGIAEEFPLAGPRSIYGATKLCSEYLIQEYCASYGIHAIINRCGLIAGPWQMGKVDQGVVMLWAACHRFRKDLAYIGYYGTGKQVRDVLHIDDLCDLVLAQMKRLDEFSGEIFNAGGGLNNSISLQEMTAICREVTGETIPVRSVPETRPNDLIWYVTDNSRVSRTFGWKPQRSVKDTVTDITRWIDSSRALLSNIL